jgi:predicted permease
MTTIAQDIRYGLRRMKATPLFTAAAIATFALGLGVNSAVLSLAHTIFLKPLPVADASRVVLVDATVPRQPPLYAFSISYPDYLYYRDHARTFEALAGHYGTSPMQITTPAGPVGITGSVSTANYFTALRLQPVVGRFFTPDEDRVPGRDAVVVLSHRLWRSSFGADDAILGQPVRINGTTFTVLGVAPDGFRGVLGPQDAVDAWIPTAMFKVGYRYCDGFARGCNMINMVGRLGEGVSIADAQAEMTLLAQQVADAYPETNKGRGLIVRPARGVRINEQTQYTSIVSMVAVAAALVLLVSSTNVAGLLLARGLQRRKEMAIQLALGASQSRLVRQFLVESSLLSLAGGVAGVLVALWSGDIMRGFFRLDLTVDLRVLAIGFGVAFVVGLVTGVGPAVQATRTDTMPAMKDESAGAGTRRTRVREALIVVQVAVSVVLLAASGLVVRSFVNVQHGPGFDPDRLIVPRLRPSLLGYSAERSWAYQREVIRRLEETPGVIAASPAEVPPLPRWGLIVLPMEDPALASSQATPVQIGATSVGPRYFTTLGVPLVEGREFDDRDTATAPRRAILNESLARRFFPQGGATGRQVRIGQATVEIIGVARNVQYVSALDDSPLVAYLNYWQQDTRPTRNHDSRTHIRVAGDAAAMLPTILNVIASVDPDVPVSEVVPLSGRLEQEFYALSTARAMFVIFGVLTLLLSSIGLYAALAFAVGQRKREIAIRMALGANRVRVGGLVLRRGSIVLLWGLAAGLLLSLGLGPILASMLYGVSPRDPLTLVAGPSILVLVALVAIWLPTRRAMTLDPLVVLRSE